MNFETLVAEFVSPPREFSPAPIWWWSGEKLEPSRLRWQMERFAEGGVFNLVILNLAPTGPLYGSDKDDPEFLSEAWWEIFQGVCKDAARLKIRLWFYDQIGFSGANFQGRVVAADPSFAGESLESVGAEGLGELSVACPSEGKALGAFVWIDGKASPVEIKAGSARHEGDGKRSLRLFYSVKRGFNYFSHEACAALIGRVHGQFEARAKQWFGKVIAGSFQDELPNVPSWGPDFTGEFKKRQGYDLLPKLASLWEGEKPEDLKVRMDYHACRAVLQEEAFFKPLFDWHEKFGLLCGVDQQGDARSGNPVDAVRIYADYLRTHRWFGAPGSDQHGETKIHSSIAHLYDRERVWIESFHSSGWGGTLEETFDWLMPWIRAGATLYNPHAAYYSTRGGWYEWAPPSTCWRQPYWKQYPLFANSVSRLCRLLSRGKHMAQVGLLFPNSTAQAGVTLGGETPRATSAKDSYKSLVGHMFFNQPIPGLLDRDCRDFDILDDDSVQRSETSKAGLSVAGETYQAMILPSCSVIEADTLKKLLAFKAAGGLLISLGAKPEWIAEAKGLRPAVEFKNLPHAETAEELSSLLAPLKRQVEAPVTTLRRKVGDADIVFVPGTYPRATRRLEGGWDPFQYDFDTDAYAKEMRILVRGVSGQPQLWDAFTGKRSALKARPCEDGMEVMLPFSAGPAALLVWGMPVEKLPALAASGGKEILELEGPWDCTLLPTLDNRYGDLDRPAKKGPPDLATWYFKHRIENDAEDGISLGWTEGGSPEEGWSETKAGYGTFGWQGVVQDLLWTRDILAKDFAGQGHLDPRGMKPSVYSLSRGMDLDPLHVSTLGPKGHVPEEFLRFGHAKKGQHALFRSSVSLKSAAELTLAVGARAAKAIWLNGVLVKEAEEDEAHLAMLKVNLKAGVNIVEFRLKALEEGELRAYWALVKDPATFSRPEWMKAPGAALKDSKVLFSTTLDLDFDPSEATLQLAVDAPLARLLVNGAEVGRQGGFDPYGGNFRVFPHTVKGFKRGKNQLQVEVLDNGSGVVAMMLDGLVQGKGGKRLQITSGSNWLASRDGSKPVPSLPYPGIAYGGPAWIRLSRRPHPLPAAEWLDDAYSGKSVLDIAPSAFGGKARVEWLRFILPPGADSMCVPTKKKFRLWIEGKEVKANKLPNPSALLRRAVLRIEANDGLNAGALLTGPVTYSFKAGQIQLGDWSPQGLRSYSGAMRYSKTFKLASLGALTLDLGRVRGTVDVKLNGKFIGARFLAPWRFELGKAAKKGPNTLEIEVSNTLAPYLRSVSPTTYITKHQETSGIFGPVRILKEKS